MAAEKAIRSGQSHQEAVSSLAKEFHNKEKLFEALSNTPRIPLRKRYKIWNYLLAILLFTTWSTMFHAVLSDIRASIILVSFYFTF